jgi:drug/metabolite transporter (DMT)-like permease
MGAAFYLWSFSLRRGVPRVIGVLANATPVLPTAMLVATGKGTLSGALIASALLISAASFLVLRRDTSAGRRHAVA